MAPRNLGILVHDDVEVLDFCGPFEAFGVTGGGHLMYRWADDDRARAEALIAS